MPTVGDSAREEEREGQGRASGTPEDYPGAGWSKGTLIYYNIPPNENY